MVTIQPLTLTLSPGRGNQLPSPEVGEVPGVRINSDTRIVSINDQKSQRDGSSHLTGFIL